MTGSLPEGLPEGGHTGTNWVEHVKACYQGVARRPIGNMLDWETNIYIYTYKELYLRVARRQTHYPSRLGDQCKKHM